jgi:cobalt/nickel transport system permease protein
MGSVHVLIGIGEAAITAATVAAVLAVRPDLVYGARGLAKPLVLKGAEGATIAVDAQEPVAVRRAAWPFLVGGGLVTLVLAGGVSFFASSAPDGLEAVAENKGFLSQAGDHPFGTWVFGDYGEVGGIPVGVAGIVGVGLVLLIAGGVAYAARSRTRMKV